MSRINGDKARYHRARKKRIAKRNRYRDLLQDSAAAKPEKKSKPKSAPAA